MEHTKTYEDCRNKMEKLLSLQEKYGLAEQNFKEKIDDLDKFQVVTPIVGKFSTGKSSLVNALLGKKYLGVKLTPETSVPTEICYGVDNDVILHTTTGETAKISLSEFIGKKYSVDEIKLIRIVLDHEFLKRISTVKIVDMPGFDSGIELHNRAIDDYLPQSNAYILTFAATEPLIPESIATFLRELKLHDMPVYILITKSKSVPESQLTECVDNIRQNAAKYLGLEHVNINCTNAKGKEIDIESFRTVLQEIEHNSQQIFAETINRIIGHEAGRLVLYLQSAIDKAHLEPSELEAEEEKCRRQLERMKEKIERTKQDFALQTEKCIGNAKAKVQSSLTSASLTLENMLLNGMEVRDKVNMVVREAILSSLKTDFEPRLRRYVEKMAEVLHVDISSDTALRLNETQILMDNAVKEVIKKSVPLILSSIGLILTGPIGAVIGLVAGLLVDLGFAKKQQNDKRRMAQEKVHNEIIPQVVNKATASISQAINEQIEVINKMIEDEAEKNIALQEKALADIKKSREDEAAAKAQKLAEMKTDLQTAKSFIK